MQYLNLFSGNFVGKSRWTLNSLQIIVFWKLKKLKFSLPQMISSNNIYKFFCEKYLLQYVSHRRLLFRNGGELTMVQS